MVFQKNVILVGNAGNGKTSLMCRKSEIAIASGIPCLLVNSRDIKEDCTEHIIKRLPIPAKMRNMVPLYLRLKLWIINMCALERIDPAAIKFLQSLSFGRDTTANHYHDYMSKDGQWKLYIAMRRLDSFLKTNSREPCVKRSKPDGTNGKRTTSVSLESVTRCLQGKIEVELNPGEIIVIEGRYGVKGEARIMEAGQKSDKEIVYEEVSYFDLIQVNP